MEFSSQASASPPSSQPIYFVSGLGADERVFQYLSLEGYHPKHVFWVDPEPQEAIASYAKRLTEQIEEEHPILVGLSFGGMIAVEMAKHIAVDKIILISSAKDQSEIPPYIKILRWVPIHQLLPVKLLVWMGFYIARWFFGTESPAESKLLRAILLDTDNRFFRWAVGQIAAWQNTEVPDSLCHIHGTGDRILPLRYVDADIEVPGGSHFMVMNKATELLKLLEKIIR